MIWVRSVLFMVVFYAMSVVVSGGFSLLFLLAPRTVIIRTMSRWGQVTTWLLRVICGVRVEIRGREHLPAGAALIAAKHQRMFDIFGSIAFLPDACFVLRKELVSIPLFGWWAVRSGMIVVDREGQATALRKLVTDAKDRMNEARQLVIFPEGTRKQPGEVGAYKPGIAALYRELNMPVTPLALSTGAHWAYRKGFLMKPGVIVFEFLPPIPPGLKRGEFMRRLEEAIDPACQRLLDEGI